jgi:hypothetical protein
MSSFPGHGVRRVFLFGRIAYSIPRIEELPRVALSMNWMLQIEHNRNAIVETRLEGGTNTVLENLCSSAKGQNRFEHLLHIRGRICRSIFRLYLKK